MVKYEGCNVELASHTVPVNWPQPVFPRFRRVANSKSFIVRPEGEFTGLASVPVS